MSDTDNQDNRLSPDTAAEPLARKAWTAYISIGIRTLVLFAACIATLIWHPDLWQIIVPVMVLGAALIAYRIAYLRTFRLYCDANGVWIYAGILPWKRGVSGVKWRDLDEAVFINGFWSWLSGSYTVQLRHRFTKGLELAATDMARGKEAVLAINAKHKQYIATQPRD